MHYFGKHAVAESSFLISLESAKFPFTGSARDLRVPAHFKGVSYIRLTVSGHCHQVGRFIHVKRPSGVLILQLFILEIVRPGCQVNNSLVDHTAKFKEHES